jgi:hypothetical protein
LVLLLALSFTEAHAQDASQPLVEHYPSGSIDTTDKAKAALGDVTEARLDVDRLYANQRVACYDKFFATSCMNDVREKRRAAMLKIRKIEIEANAFLRKEKAAERDRALVEREAKAKQQPDRSLPITGKTREPAAEVPDSPDVQAPPKAPVNGEQ